MIKHWNKEIKVFKENIKKSQDEIRKRGEQQ